MKVTYGNHGLWLKYRDIRNPAAPDNRAASAVESQTNARQALVRPILSSRPVGTGRGQTGTGRCEARTGERGGYAGKIYISKVTYLDYVFARQYILVNLTNVSQYSRG